MLRSKRPELALDHLSSPIFFVSNSFQVAGLCVLLEPCIRNFVNMFCIRRTWIQIRRMFLDILFVIFYVPIPSKTFSVLVSSVSTILGLKSYIKHVP